MPVLILRIWGMINSKGVIAFGLRVHKYVAIMVLLVLGVWNPLAILGAYIGSVIPDADTPYSGSLICKILPLWMFGRDKYHCHRKVTHSWFGMMFFSALALIPSAWGHAFGWGFLAGYFLHLFADSTTPVSLPYALWPFKYNADHPYFKEYK